IQIVVQIARHSTITSKDGREMKEETTTKYTKNKGGGRPEFDDGVPYVDESEARRFDGVGARGRGRRRPESLPTPLDFFRVFRVFRGSTTQMNNHIISMIMVEARGGTDWGGG